jgi:spore maturation protein CgeB
MKSVLHVALIAPSGYSNKGIMDGFLNSGFTEYFCFDFQLQSFSIGCDLMRRALIQEAERIKPDLIFCQVQGSEILDLQTWQALQRIAFTVNYTFDIRSKEKTEWMYNLVPHIGLMCFSSQEDVDECKRIGYSNAMVLQSSADPDIYKPAEGTERKGVVFIGNNFVNTNMEFPLSKERVEMVEFLQKEFPNDFKVYGNNWGGSKLVGQKEEVEIYQSAAIVINHNNFDQTLYCSDRIWRTMFCGALCLTKYFMGIESLVEYPGDDVRMTTWSTLAELKDKVSFYLLHTKLATEMGKRFMQYALIKHTWSSRVKEMMAFILNNLMDTKEWSFPVVDDCTKMGAHVIDGKIPEPFDQHLDGRPCDCGKLKYVWTECGCTLKEWQLRAQENI